MKRNLFFLIVGFLSIISVSAQEVYQRVRIYADDIQLAYLQQQGIGIDHGTFKRGHWFESDFSATDVARLQATGIAYEIIANNAWDFYQKQAAAFSASRERGDNCGGSGSNSLYYKTPADFNLGSMGGFFTYDEMLAHLDNMASKYPDLITAKAAIDTFKTFQNRPIYYLKISDNPTADETAEPKALFTAVHHAREPESLSQMIFFMYYLLENYNTDAAVKSWVDDNEIYIIPCVNPDGYIYNSTTNPAGGGFWRKNRRDNGDGTFGVDLNRNYGHFWGNDDEGSSPETSSDTYRGTAPFSEPETQAVKWLCEQVPFTIAQNYHTYSDMLIYPWGYIGDFETPDSLTFRAHSDWMSYRNNFLTGTGNQTVGYLTNGDSDDWMYGERDIYAYTPEVGALGFWPPQEMIVPQCYASMDINVATLRVLGNSARLTATDAADVVLGENGFIHFDLQRLGLNGNGNFVVSAIPVSQGITFGAPQSFNAMELLETRSDSLSYSVDINALEGNEEVTFLLNVSNGQYLTSDTLRRKFAVDAPTADYNIILEPSLDAFAADWSVNGGGEWNVTTFQYHSAPSSITDSPVGYYEASTHSTLRWKDTIDLTAAQAAEVEFWAKWDIETDFDYVQIQAVNIANNSVTALCGKYTNTTNYEIQNEPLYDGLQDTWVKENISLNDLLGEKIFLQLYLYSDQYEERDGFYVDDILVKIQSPEEEVGLPATPLSDNETVMMQISPNPASDVLRVSYTQPYPDAHIQICDMWGRSVFGARIDHGNGTLSVATAHLAKGLYYIQLKNNGIVAKRQKFMIK